MVLHTEQSTYDEFRESWVQDIESLESTVDKGREFAIKLASHWLDVEPDSDEFHYTDGSGDGGIDVAYLHRGTSNTDGAVGVDAQGDTWYVFQCKYGAAGLVRGFVRTELRKMFETITGHGDVSRPAESTVGKIRNFVNRYGSKDDRLVLVIGTVGPLKQEELESIDEARRDFADQLGGTGPSLDIDAVSIKTLHDELQRTSSKAVRVHLNGVFQQLNAEGAWIGRVSIKAMYDMLLEYRRETGELDRIYDKNVRRWLGMGKHRKVGFGIAETIRDAPENLGIYNNGVTFVCSGFEKPAGNRRGRTLVDPYIVNGCQTTRTLFQVVDQVLGAGGSKKRTLPGKSYSDCYFVAKVVETADPKRLIDITRYTNTQNAVREADLIATDANYNDWKQELETKHGMYLEIQRGGWDSRRAYEKARPRVQPRLTGGGALPVKANDIIKVFSAGWLGYAGTAGRRNDDFLPGPEGYRSAFGEIKRLADEGRFGADDFKAGQAVFLAGKRLGFGARRQGIERATTRHVFYYVFIELIRAISSSGRTPASLPTEEVTRHVLTLEQHADQFAGLADIAAQTVTDYTRGTSDTAPYMLDKAFRDTENWEGMVKSHRMDAKNIAREVPRFRQAIDNRIAAMQMSMGVDPSIFDQYRELLGVGNG